MNRNTYVLLWILWQNIACSVPAELPSDRTTRSDIQPAVKIPLRDGTKLCASIYLPKVGESGFGRSLPVIATMTPYHRQSWDTWGRYFASHGYVFASIDVRGRGDSEGRFEPYLHEGRDGFDVVEWLAKQSYCDGPVGLWGGSYGGFNQWAIAAELPPHLGTIVPVAAAYPGVDVPFYNNIGQPYLMQWLTSLSGGTREKLADDSPYWRKRFLAAYREHVPFKLLDAFCGSTLASFQQFVRHPSRDGYYDGFTPTAKSYQKLSIPILTLTGQYDDEAFGALAYYRDHLRQGNPEAVAKHYLVIGPWDHAGTRVPTDEVGGIRFGRVALLDLKDLYRQWYDWTLKKGPQPSFLKKRLSYYLLGPGNQGKGEWQYADNLEMLAAKNKMLYIDSDDKNAETVSHPGRLSATLPRNGSDQFTYDPMVTRRGESIDGVDSGKGELIDSRYALSIGGDGLVYETDPFREETQMVGCPSLRLWLSLDTPDTDLEAYLYEVLPDGTSLRVWTHTCRLRYRESPRQAKLMKAGEIVACDFAPGLFVARRLMKGSRLRLVVSCPNTIWAEKNYNSGGVVAEETAKDARVAHIRVYHDPEHTSALLIPLGSP